jgi:hypothetical protein
LDRFDRNDDGHVQPCSKETEMMTGMCSHVPRKLPSLTRAMIRIYFVDAERLDTPTYILSQVKSVNVNCCPCEDEA